MSAFLNAKLLCDLTTRLRSHRDAQVLVGLLNNFADKSKFTLKLRQFATETLDCSLSKSQVQLSLDALVARNLISITVYPQKYTEAFVNLEKVAELLTGSDETSSFDFPGSFEKPLAIYDLVYPEASKA